MNGWKVDVLLTILDQKVQNLSELGMVLLDNLFAHYEILKKYVYCVTSEALFASKAKTNIFCF